MKRKTTDVNGHEFGRPVKIKGLSVVVCCKCGAGVITDDRERVSGSALHVECVRAKHIYSSWLGEIEQCDLQGNVVRVWHSADCVRAELGYTSNIIRDCVHGRRRDYKGFLWRTHSKSQ